MTAPITPALATATASASAGRGPILGKQDFLSMLVAQLRNQDPMSPMDGADYAAQLAQFSTVEQLLEIATKLDAQSADVARSVLVGQTQLGASLIGREVMVRGATLISTGETPGRVVVELPEGATNLDIEVFAADGQRVGSQQFGTQPAGRAVLTLDALDLPPGAYTYKVTALGSSGLAAAHEAFTIGLVEGMSFAGGQVVLRINGTLVPMLDIVEILTPAPTAGSTSPTEESSQP